MKALRGLALLGSALTGLSVAAGDLAAQVIGGFDLARGGGASLKSGSLMAGIRSAILEAAPCAQFSEANVLTSAYLGSIDVLIIFSATGSTTVITPLTAAEQSAVFNFVRNGGGALISADNSTFAGAATDAANESVLDPFGLDVTGTLSNNQAATAIVSHAILTGPYGTVTTLASVFPGWFDNLGPYAQAIARLNANAGNTIAVVEPSAITAGSGGVVLTSDTNYFLGITFPTEAKKLVENSLHFAGGYDKVPPSIAAPANLDLNTDPGSCSRAAANVILGSATGGDNCSAITLTNNAPAVFPKGPTAVIWTATDVAGNTSTATQTVTVNDTEDPVVTAPAAISVTTSAGAALCGALVDDAGLGAATATDNCPDVTVTRSGVPADRIFPFGTTTITYTATDAAGHTTSATQSVTVVDGTAPNLANVPAAASFQCVAQVPAGAPGDVQVTDNDCRSAPVVTVNDTDDGGAGSTASPLVITRTYTATDAAGNTASATQGITIVDSTAPTITAPPAVTVGTAAGAPGCDALVSDPTLGSATADDNCSGAVAVIRTGVPAGNRFPVGTTTVTYTAMDAAGNLASETQVVTVQDQTPPALTAPADLVLEADAGSCGRERTNITLGAALAADNCSDVSIANDAPATFPAGTTTVTWTATDAAGNQSQATQAVTIRDLENPTVTAPPAVSAATGPDATVCSATVGDVVLGTATYADNCAGATLSRSGVPAGNAFPVGTTAVTYRVTDAAGNEATATQAVTVVDDTPPTITAPADVSAASGSNVDLGAPITSDNCGVASVTSDAPATFPPGTTTVTWTVTDSHGSRASDTQTVTITGSTTLTASILVRSVLHSIESGSRPQSTKTPLALALKVFPRGSGPAPDPHDYGTIWNSGPGIVPPNSSITGPELVMQGQGPVNLYTILVAAGSKYLVIGQANVLCHGVPTNIYVGRQTDQLAANSTTRQHLQVLQRANGSCVPAYTDEIPGSLLLVTQPEYLEFETAEELLPIVYESVVGNWSVAVEAAPPEGFVSDPPQALTATLSDNTLQVLQFTITDVGSTWTATRITHHIRHRGRNIEHFGSSRMINRRTGRPAPQTASSGAEETEAIPTAYALLQSTPDPFNPTTTLRFELPEPADVTLRVYDVSGHQVAELADRQRFEAGRHRLVFNAQGLPTGIYIYQIRANAFRSSRKMVLVK